MGTMRSSGGVVAVSEKAVHGEVPVEEAVDGKQAVAAWTVGRWRWMMGQKFGRSSDGASQRGGRARQRPIREEALADTVAASEVATAPLLLRCIRAGPHLRKGWRPRHS
jgi:hypothetical protein